MLKKTALSWLVPLVSVITYLGCYQATAQQDRVNRFAVEFEQDGDQERKVARTLEKWGTCSAYETSNRAQTIVNIAVAEWARFGFPVWEIGQKGLKLFPRRPDYEIVSEDNNPFTNGFIPRLIRQGVKEDDPEAEDAIGEYWSVIPGSLRFRPGISHQQLLWNAYPSAGWAVPWSAAFVSWVMCEAGLEMNSFKRDASHFGYAQDIYRHGKDRAFQAFSLSDLVTPEPGDILCADRQSSSGDMINSIQDDRFAKGKGRLMHCDIIVKVSPSRLFAIGGNVIDGVTLTSTPVDSDGKLVHSVERYPDSRKPIRHWFGLLKLKENIDDQETVTDLLPRAMQQAIVVQKKAELVGE